MNFRGAKSSVGVWGGKIYLISSGLDLWRPPVGSFGPRATPCLLVSGDLRRCYDVVLPRAGWGGFDEPSIPDFSMIRHPVGHPVAEIIVCVIPVNAPQLRTHNSWSGFAFGQPRTFRAVSSQRRATVKSSSFVPSTAGSLSPRVADSVDPLSKQEATSSRAKVPQTHRLEAKIAAPDGRGHSKTTPSSTRMLSTPTHDLVTHFQALRCAQDAHRQRDSPPQQRWK